MRTSPEVLGRTLAAAPDPDLARLALSRVGEDRAAREALEDHLPAAAALLGFSTAAADFLSRHPGETADVLRADPRTRTQLLAEAEGTVARLGPEAGLRRFRRRALWRLATRDLLGAEVDEVVAEMTGIAEACLEVAAAAVRAPLAIIGMGKLGGAELNYASDVDVIFVHGDDPERGAAAARRLLALLSAPTADGVALRVDTDLRPEGRAGPLTRSAPATLEYYRRHAATWERQALLKARSVAGERGLGERLLEDLASVIYPERIDPGAIDDVRGMKVRIEEYVRARGKESTEVKRGRGGIRDVEFAVQLLQMVHGRRDPALRTANTLAALAALGSEGYVAVADAVALADSYRFLRALEHRLQLLRELQTHDLPGDPHVRRRVARSLGLADAAALTAAHEEHTRTVRGLHERLFYRPLLEAFAGPQAPAPGTDRAATEELLAGLGFTDRGAAFDRFARLVDPGGRRGKILGRAFPLLAPALSLAASPDAALVRLERVVERMDDAAADAVAGDPTIARRLGLVAAGSTWLAEALARDGIGPLARALEDMGSAHRMVAIGARYLAGEAPVPELGRLLADVADDVVAEALAGASPRVPLAVIALGKLGGRELSFASDLDLVFVYEGEGAADFQEAERAAEEILRLVRERGFQPDPDLRPEGRSGPLARSLTAFLEYWQRWGQTWEFQALLRARPVAGDEVLGRRWALAAEDFAYPEHLPLERVAEIRRMRVRMESERVRPAEGRFNLKLGYGGLADVQFAVELQLMRHGRNRPEVRRRHTLEALESLAAARLVEDSVALALGEAYVFLTEVKNAIEVDRRLPAEAIPPTPEEQLAVARRLGYDEAARHRMLEDYRRVTRRARRAMERVFYEEDV